MTAWGAGFTGALALACATDVRHRRIPNVLVVWLTVAGAVFGASVVGPSVGLSRALVGGAIGFALWIPFYALRMLGAGDVKLFAAACCWLAPQQIFVAAVISACTGGVLAVVAMVFAHGPAFTLVRLSLAVRHPASLATGGPRRKGRRTIPYGVAMAIGLLTVAWAPRLVVLR